MRPPLLSTPPVSHVISRKLKPTPAVTCSHDWRNLTSDTSIQIMSLETSEFHEHDSLYDVSNHLSFIDTVISPRADDNLPRKLFTSSPHIDETCVAETLISLDSLTRHQGNVLDARIIFTPKGPCSVSGSRCQSNSHMQQNIKTELSLCQQRLTRSYYSDSNLEIQTKANNEYINRHALVARSMSLNYSEYARRNNDTRLVKPLLPCANRSKICDVKRIPSFRETVKAVAKTSAEHASNKVNTCINKQTRIPTFLPGNIGMPQGGIQNAEIPRSKIAKLVKSGLKSVIKSKSGSGEKCARHSDKVKNISTIERRRHRRARHTTDIGGLSEFLRRNERRRTVAVVTEEMRDSVVQTDKILSRTNAVVAITETPEQSVDELKPTRITMENRRFHSMGTSNLKYNQCQRKLVFQGKHSSPKANEEFDPSNYVEKYICLEKERDSQPRRRPKLGILGITKPANIVTFDDLEIDIVHDLKRRVERANRYTRIMTNGSLKMKPKIPLVERPKVSSPRRKGLCRQTRTSTYPSRRHLRLKRESIV